jgi:hypothetical protein
MDKIIYRGGSWEINAPPEIKVSDRLSKSEMEGAIDNFDNDDYVVVWVGENAVSKSGKDIFAKRYASSGAVKAKPNYPVDTNDDGMSQAATSVIYQYDVSAIPYNKRPQTYTANLPVFDGTNYLEIPYTPALNTPQFTIAVWANTHQSDWGQRMFDNFNNITTRHGYAVAFHSDINKYNFLLENGSTSYSDFFSNEIELNRWYHFVFQYDGTKQIIYQNGVKVAESARALSLNTQQKFTIGARYSNDYIFNGHLYDFRYYNRPLSQTEITNIYTTGKAIATPTFGTDSVDLLTTPCVILDSEYDGPYVNVGFAIAFPVV